MQLALIKITKPTGSGVRPVQIEHAHAIERLINERAGTRNLNDSDFDADDEPEILVVDSDDDHDFPPAPTVKLSAHVSRPETVVPRRNARNTNGLELEYWIPPCSVLAIRSVRADPCTTPTS
jgi:hypothetical protein